MENFKVCTFSFSCWECNAIDYTTVWPNVSMTLWPYSCRSFVSTDVYACANVHLWIKVGIERYLWNLQYALYSWMLSHKLLYHPGISAAHCDWLFESALMRVNAIDERQIGSRQLVGWTWWDENVVLRRDKTDDNTRTIVKFMNL